MKISIIVAVAKNGVIGHHNKLIWHLSDDLKNFKKITYGHYVIMGRKTFASIGRPLPGRTNIVLSRNKLFKPEGCIVFPSVDEAIHFAVQHEQEEIFIIGGEQVYRSVIDYADKIYLTRVHASPEGDAYFTELNTANWREISRRTIRQDDRNEYDFDILELEKRSD